MTIVNSNYAVAMEDVLMKDILQTSPMLIDAFAIPVSLKLSYVHFKASVWNDYVIGYSYEPNDTCSF